MREFKFRAWDKWKKIMIQPNDGDFIGWHAMSKWRDCLELMQYTGIDDKSGKPIYEGDIVRISSVQCYDFADPDPETKIIWWDKENSKFGFQWINWKPSTSGYTLCKGNEGLFEVIGNRWENKSLLRSDS